LVHAVWRLEKTIEHVNKAKFTNFYVYTTMLDEWLEKIKACEPLPENDLRQLCEMARSKPSKEVGCGGGARV
jgi:hypothetical protein